MKEPRKEADLNIPLIIKTGSTIRDVCDKLHRDFKSKFRYATVTGPSAKHDMQKVGLDHIVKDQDILTIVISRY